MLIDVPLSGDRSYIHGADIFDALVNKTGAAAGMVLTLSAASDCVIEAVAVPRLVPTQHTCGTFRYADNTEVRRFLLSRRPDLPISARVEFDDEAVTHGATFSRLTAKAPRGGSGQTFMQRAIALYIALLGHDYPEDYWSIAEIAGSRLPCREAAIELSIVKQLGTRFWKAEIWGDGVQFGHVILARGKPHS